MTRASISAKSRGNASNSLDLTNPDHIARFNALNSRLISATRYFDENFLTNLGVIDDIPWLFARGDVGC